jgi:2-methylisocitrate lyase-like PEP mutase family enzyme
MPNPWDAGSAIFLERLGFQALATTSSGFAFSRGLPDLASAISIELMLEHLREIAAATRLPVSADFQSGYADDPEGVADSVARCVKTGVAGLSIEDSSGDESLYGAELAVERVRAARAAIDASGTGAVLTARCEAYLIGDPQAARTARERLVAFADAGADCLFAPGVRDPDEIAALVQAVAPRPLNVLVSGPVPGLGLARLAELGVRRISVGSGLARAAWAAFMHAARGLADGSFDGLAGAAPFAELNELFRAR